jgi:hypothetical protein
MSRVRHYTHLFTGTRITATRRIDLDLVAASGGRGLSANCKWEGSKERDSEPTPERFREYKTWMDSVLADVAAQTGMNLLFIFEPPPGNLLEAWQFRPGEPPCLHRVSLRPPDWKTRKSPGLIGGFV